MDRSTFRGILQNMSLQKFSENLVFIENIKIFQSLTKKQKEALANAMITENYKSGSRILREGDSGDFMFIIKEGSVIVTKKGFEIRKLGKNEYFGEQALLHDNLRTATVTALEQISCLSISAEGLYTALGSHLQSIIHVNSQRMAIDENLILNRLTVSQINNLVQKTQIVKYKRGGIIINQGSRIESLYIILSGSIGGKYKKVKTNEILGYDELITGAKVLLENYVAIEDSVIAQCTKNEFEEAIGGRLALVLE